MKVCLRLLFIVLFLNLFYPNTAILASGQNNAVQNLASNGIFVDLVHDFQLYNSLLSEVNYYGLNAIPIHARTIDEAVNYLETGFESELARSISTYYLQYQEDIKRLVVIPTESIPIITENDLDKINMTYIDEQKVVLQRVYFDCYFPGDAYLYTIFMIKVENRWEINSLSLQEM